MNTIYTCGIKINPLSVDEICSICDNWLREGKKGLQITGVNLRQMSFVAKQPEFKKYVNESEIVNIDGTAVYWYLRLKGFKLKGRSLCADIFYRILNTANERKESIYFLGATQETIEKVVANIHVQYPNINIVGYHNGFFEDEHYIVDDIASNFPDYLFIGMPSPFKERFVFAYKKKLNAGVCFGVGGMFDITAGKAKRAPERVQKTGLEWLYRISQNPIMHSKRVIYAFFPCMRLFIAHLFERRKQTF